MSTTEADAQAWLERQADHFTEAGEFTSDIVPGVSGLGCGVIFDADARHDMSPYDRFDPGPRTFWCRWRGRQLTTVRP